MIIGLLNIDKIIKIVPAKTKDFKTQAERPLFSALRSVRFAEVFKISLTNWRECISLSAL